MFTFTMHHAIFTIAANNRQWNTLVPTVTEQSPPQSEAHHHVSISLPSASSSSGERCILSKITPFAYHNWEFFLAQSTHQTCGGAFFSSIHVHAHQSLSLADGSLSHWTRRLSTHWTHERKQAEEELTDLFVLHKKLTFAPCIEI